MTLRASQTAQQPRHSQQQASDRSRKAAAWWQRLAGCFAPADKQTAAEREDAQQWARHCSKAMPAQLPETKGQKAAMSDVDAEATITSSGSEPSTQPTSSCNDTACDVCQDPLPPLTPPSSGGEEEQQSCRPETPVASQPSPRSRSMDPYGTQAPTLSHPSRAPAPIGQRGHSIDIACSSTVAPSRMNPAARHPSFTKRSQISLQRVTPNPHAAQACSGGQSPCGAANPHTGVSFFSTAAKLVRLTCEYQSEGHSLCSTTPKPSDRRGSLQLERKQQLGARNCSRRSLRHVTNPGTSSVPAPTCAPTSSGQVAAQVQAHVSSNRSHSGAPHNRGCSGRDSMWLDMPCSPCHGMCTVPSESCLAALQQGTRSTTGSGRTTADGSVHASAAQVASQRLRLSGDFSREALASSARNSPRNSGSRVGSPLFSSLHQSSTLTRWNAMLQQAAATRASLDASFGASAPLQSRVGVARQSANGKHLLYEPAQGGYSGPIRVSRLVCMDTAYPAPSVPQMHLQPC